MEVSGDAMKVIDISGLWRAPAADGRDWRCGRWWEHGFVRRVELPEDAEWRKVEVNMNFAMHNFPRGEGKGHTITSEYKSIYTCIKDLKKKISYYLHERTKL